MTVLFFEKKSRQKKLQLSGSMCRFLIICTDRACKKAKETSVIGEFARSFNYPHGRGVKSKTDFSSLLFINPRRRRTTSLQSSLLSLISKKSRSCGIFCYLRSRPYFLNISIAKLFPCPRFLSTLYGFSPELTESKSTLLSPGISFISSALFAMSCIWVA